MGVRRQRPAGVLPAPATAGGDGPRIAPSPATFCHLPGTQCRHCMTSRRCWSRKDAIIPRVEAGRSPPLVSHRWESGPDTRRSRIIRDACATGPSCCLLNADSPAGLPSTRGRGRTRASIEEGLGVGAGRLAKNPAPARIRLLPARRSHSGANSDGGSGGIDHSAFLDRRLNDRPLVRLPVSVFHLPAPERGGRAPVTPAGSAACDPRRPRCGGHPDRRPRR